MRKNPDAWQKEIHPEFRNGCRTFRLNPDDENEILYIRLTDKNGHRRYRYKWVDVPKPVRRPMRFVRLTYYETHALPDRQRANKERAVDLNEEVERMILEGATQNEIKRTLNTSSTRVTNVRRMLIESGRLDATSTGYRRLSNKEKEGIAKMLRQGDHTAQYIANRYGVSRATVINIRNTVVYGED